MPVLTLSETVRMTSTYYDSWMRAMTAGTAVAIPIIQFTCTQERVEAGLITFIIRVVPETCPARHADSRYAKPESDERCGNAWDVG